MLQLIGVILSFFLVILLIRFKINFGFALILGAVLLTLFSINTTNITEIPIKIFQDQRFLIDTIELIILTTLIFMLAKTMQETGAITKLIESFRTIFRKGGTIGVIPAIYGLMPIPGGALFSAPVVQEEGKEFNINVDKKNFLNIWFRHIWFPIYPISITILTMAKLAEIEVIELIKTNFLTFVFMILIGIFLLTFIVKKNTKNKETKKIDLSCIKKECRGLIFLLPTIIPIFFVIFYYFFDISLEICFIFGILTSIITLLYLIKTPKTDYKKLLKKTITWKFAVIIIGIMLFRKIFELTESNQAIFNMLQNFNIPIILIIIALPFILGIVSGYLLLGITLSYPLLSPFLPATDLTVTGLASIIFISSFIGYLISPIHLCNILSSEYLKTDTIKMYPIFIPAALSILIFHVIIIISFF